MRISIVGTRGFPSTYGGFETFVRVLAPYLADRGHEVIVYGRGNCRPHRRIRLDRVDVVNTFGVDTKSLSTLTHGLAAATDSAIRKPDAALVLNVANGYFLPFLRARGIPTLLNVDGLEWERAKWNRLGKQVFKTGANLSARWASELVADSRAIADAWGREFGRHPIFIPYGAPEDEPVGTTRVRALGLVPDRYFLVVARLVPENNIDLTLAAYSASKSDLPLVIVGSTGRADSQREPSAANRDRSVRWLGHVSDQSLLAELWANATAYIHGHSVGGTNPALLQALGYGAPVLAYDTPYNAEVIGGRAELYGSPAELREKLDALASDEAARNRLSEEGKRRVAAHYRWDQVCASYEAALARLAMPSAGSADRRPTRSVAAPSAE